jgi:hypothetical protein
VEPQVPELDDSLNVAWPAHVEDAARYWEAETQRMIADDEEFREARARAEGNEGRGRGRASKKS